MKGDSFDTIDKSERIEGVALFFHIQSQVRHQQSGQMPKYSLSIASAVCNAPSTHP